MSKEPKPYSLTAPCSNCPFRTDIRPYLTAARIVDIQKGTIEGEFYCHKTTKSTDWGEDDVNASDRLPTKDSKHCAGALILKEKLNEPSQMMRIAERLGMYDRNLLDMDAPVFNSWEEMEEAQDG